MSDNHTCAYPWCEASGPSPAEHYSWDSVEAADGMLSCNAWVVTDQAYEDEILIHLQPSPDEDGIGVSLTDEQALKLRQLIDVALGRRAEVRSGARNRAPAIQVGRSVDAALARAAEIEQGLNR